MLKELRNKKLEIIINKVQNGDIEAIKYLLNSYSPLIYRTCQTLYNRYGGLVPIIELVENAKHLLLSLTILEYKTDGKARYPHFIKTHLHARLTQIYRPVIAYRSRAVELKENIYIPPSHYEEIFKEEREKTCEALYQWMNTNLNDRELEIVYQHMCKDIPRTHLAKLYGVSATRMKQLHHRCLEKIHKYLELLGINSMKDI